MSTNLLAKDTEKEEKEEDDNQPRLYIGAKAMSMQWDIGDVERDQRYLNRLFSVTGQRFGNIQYKLPTLNMYGGTFSYLDGKSSISYSGASGDTNFTTTSYSISRDIMPGVFSPLDFQRVTVLESYARRDDHNITFSKKRTDWLSTFFGFKYQSYEFSGNGIGTTNAGDGVFNALNDPFANRIYSTGMHQREYRLKTASGGITLGLSITIPTFQNQALQLSAGGMLLTGSSLRYNQHFDRAQYNALTSGDLFYTFLGLGLNSEDYLGYNIRQKTLGIGGIGELTYNVAIGERFLFRVSYLQQFSDSRELYGMRLGSNKYGLQDSFKGITFSAMLRIF